MKNVKKGCAAVITGGEAPSEERALSVLRDCSFVVAADSGLERALEYGITPDLVVGDMDSLTDTGLLSSFKEEQIRIFPADKDYTDTELALREIENYGKRILIGGGEGRLDHTLSLIALFEGPHGPDLWISRHEEIFAIDGNLELLGKPGDLISFCPLGDRDISYKAEGLKWTFDRVRWGEGEMSLSNRFTGERVRLTRERGRLLVIRSLPESRA